METDDALWQRHIQINQYGCFLGMKAVVPAMERSGGRLHREHLIGRRPQGLARVLRLCRDQMGAAGDDQVGGDRPRRPQNQSELGSSWSNRHRHDRVPHAEQREERMKQVPMHRHGTPEEVAPAGGIPALRREQLHHRRGDRHRRCFIGIAPSRRRSAKRWRGRGARTSRFRIALYAETRQLHQQADSEFHALT